MARALSRTERLLRRKLAVKVRELRSARRLTVEEAADRAGMHPRLWQKAEAGELNATIQTMARLADALEVEAYVLIK